MSSADVSSADSADVSSADSEDVAIDVSSADVSFDLASCADVVLCYCVLS